MPNAPVLSKWLACVPFSDDRTSHKALLEATGHAKERYLLKILVVLKFVIRVKASTPVTLLQVSSMSGRLCLPPVLLQL